jgi:hypothetical protein
MPVSAAESLDPAKRSSEVSENILRAEQGSFPAEQGKCRETPDPTALNAD